MIFRESLSIGIVTYNNRDTIIEAVQSLLECQPDDIEMTIYLLDNASQDGTFDLLKSTYGSDSQIILEASKTNLGFGAGNNAILKRVSTTWHCFCNPDIEVTKGVFETLIATLRSHPELGLLSPKFLFKDGTLQPLNKRNPTVFDLFIRRFIHSSLQTTFEARLKKYEMLDQGYEHSYDVPFASGAFMFCRTQALTEIGGFDERYFLYFEDADISREMQRAGWGVRFEPAAVVYHGWNRAAHNSLLGMRLFVCSGIRYFNKWGWEIF